MLCKTCIYDDDRSYCEVPDFRDIIDCTVYAPKERDKSYIIPYNFPLNTRRGFRTIYYLMKLTQSDMIKVITSIISVRHSAIDEIIDKCDNISNENNYILSFLLQRGYIG